MGVFMLQDDIYISSLLDLLNLRFGPSEGTSPDQFSGIDEMVELQKEFQILKKGRSFKDTAAILNLGGFWNARSKNRWFNLLESLKKVGSNRGDLTGDQAIVDALMANLSGKEPLPVHFTSHDLRAKGDNQVIIKEAQRSVFYIEQQYLTISIPMKPRPATKSPRKK
ncbi:MAG TPA: hypothetical protein VEN29_02950 [Casimicrobiaceae bacterium]|nr:hypothetical protein [Casimicrobiaceae bacterium]